jgi:hypothetical protein
LEALSEIVPRLSLQQQGMDGVDGMDVEAEFYKEMNASVGDASPSRRRFPSDGGDGHGNHVQSYAQGNHEAASSWRVQPGEEGAAAAVAGKTKSRANTGTSSGFDDESNEDDGGDDNNDNDKKPAAGVASSSSSASLSTASNHAKGQARHESSGGDSSGVGGSSSSSSSSSSNSSGHIRGDDKVTMGSSKKKVLPAVASSSSAFMAEASVAATAGGGGEHKESMNTNSSSQQLQVQLQEPLSSLTSSMNTTTPKEKESASGSAKNMTSGAAAAGERQRNTSASHSTVAVQIHTYDEALDVTLVDPDPTLPRPPPESTLGQGQTNANNAGNADQDQLSTPRTVMTPMFLKHFKPATGCTNASDFIVRCFVARLRGGITVVKHGRSRWCKSRLRQLHIHSDGRSLSWRPALGEPTTSRRPPKLDLSTCLEVRHAWSPDPDAPLFTGTSILRQKCEAANAHKSFALLFEKRTVDLTAVTADQCKVLMEGFSALCFRLHVANLAEKHNNEHNANNTNNNNTSNSHYSKEDLFPVDGPTRTMGGTGTGSSAPSNSHAGSTHSSNHHMANKASITNKATAASSDNSS